MTDYRSLITQHVDIEFFNPLVLARRIVAGVGVQRGELILVRDEAGRQELTEEITLAVELAGATPLVQTASADYLERLWNGAPLDYLKQWDKHRAQWVEACDRVIVLAGAYPDFEKVDIERVAAWQSAETRLTDIEENPPRPYLVAAIPTERRAKQLGISLEWMEAKLFPALTVPVLEMQREIQRTISKIQGKQDIRILSGANCELRMTLGERRWMTDDGFIDAIDQANGAIVSNLPAGSVYTTVVEDSAEGTLYFSNILDNRDVTLHFKRGRVIYSQNGFAVEELFNGHSGEPRRISHIGLGLNPKLRKPIGWTLVDEHVEGQMFIAFGENQYMGGKNQSSLNMDFLVDGKLIVAGDTIN